MRENHQIYSHCHRRGIEGSGKEPGEEMIYKITPLADCKACQGHGTVYDTVDYGSTTADLPSDCSCVEEQVPEEFDEAVDEIEIIDNGWQGGDGPEFEDGEK